MSPGPLPPQPLPVSHTSFHYSQTLQCPLISQPVSPSPSIASRRKNPFAVLCLIHLDTVHSASPLSGRPALLPGIFSNTLIYPPQYLPDQMHFNVLALASTWGTSPPCHNTPPTHTWPQDSCSSVRTQPWVTLVRSNLSPNTSSFRCALFITIMHCYGLMCPGCLHELSVSSLWGKNHLTQ